MTGGFVIQPPIDAIAEFRILTHNANAEFGRNTGSTTNIVDPVPAPTRFTVRPGSFSVTTPWTVPTITSHAVIIQPLKQNQFGATFGGPIKKDKTFFFGFYEGFRNRQGETDSATVPSIPEHGGDFTQLCTSVGGQFNGGVCTDSGGNFLPNGQLFSLFTGAPVPVPNNTLPGIDPTSQNVLPFFPLPNSGANTFALLKPRARPTTSSGIRLDHYLSASDTLNFRYRNFGGGPTTDPLYLPVPMSRVFPSGPIFALRTSSPRNRINVFSPTVVAVARISYLRNKSLFGTRTNHESLSDLGFQYQPTLDSAAGRRSFGFAGYASVGPDPITGPRISSRTPSTTPVR